ncbi:MAG: YeeE/YedE thiosulfate transporter family protein, partial [Candidatus Hodarchaeales archaeon]
MVLPILDFTFALLIGGLTGIVLQRGRACTNTAFRNLLLIRNSDIFLGIVITVVVELIGYQILSFMVVPGFVFQSNPIEFSLILVPFGAFIFGLGTVIAGGCAGGTCYRIGEGSIKSLSAFFGFTFGIGILVIGPIADF